MEEIKDTPFNGLSFPADAKVSVQDNLVVLEKYNWDFLECEKFQVGVNKIIQKNKNYKFYIFTNHPHVFTLGRGNERDQENLVDFNPALKSTLNFPVHDIHRGGGITFHYPGQWIFYPICAVSPSYTLDDHMCWILKATKKTLESYGLDNLITAKKLMGIWRDKKKVASIGVGLQRFVSLHGLALNLNYDEKMFNELPKINPCGLNSDIYLTAENVINKTIDPQDFTLSFLNNI